MQIKNIKLMMAINQLLQPFDWLALPIGIMWFSYLQNKSDILMMIISAISYYILFLVCCNIANFIISILYSIIMPICILFHNIKSLISLLHIIFFSIWALIAYSFLINISPEYMKTISLILYSSITLPFIFYGNKNIDTISEIELTYILILKIASFISCLALLLFNINMYVFVIIIIITFLCFMPLIMDTMEN